MAGRRVMWVTSDTVLDGVWVEKLRERGYSVKTVERPSDALDGLGTLYDGIVLNPALAPEDVSRDFTGLYDVGMGVYRSVRESGVNSMTPLYLFIASNPQPVDRRPLDEVVGEDALTKIVMARDCLPTEFADRLDRDLGESV